jgi:hypothetical protein
MVLHSVSADVDTASTIVLRRRFISEHVFWTAGLPAWSAGGNVSETAVDMPLRLDNAGALPTCRQPQQQKQTAITD